jgi:uncharacterized protein
MAKVELPVRGMTCTACERRVTAALDKVPGVVGVAVSARRGTARLRIRGPANSAALHEAIRGAGYDVGRDASHWLSRDREVWRDVLLAVVGVAALAMLLNATGALELANRAGTLTSTGSLAVVVLLGVAAGLSTCMALVGGLVLAISARFAEQHRELTARQRLRPQLAFNLGRIAGFAVLGAVVGLLGSAFSLNGRVLAFTLIGVSVVMGVVGLRLTHVSPRFSRAGSFTLPPAIAARLGLLRAGSGYSDRRAALLGAGTFLLPCGFTQAVQVLAMSTGSPWRASAIMTLFAVGTLPGLLGIGGLTAIARGAFATSFFRFAGVVVVALAALNINGSLGLLYPGLRQPPPAEPAAATVVAPGQSSQRPLVVQPPVGAEAPDPAADERPGPESLVTDNVTLDGDVQIVRTTQEVDGYYPPGATVIAGVPIEWQIESVGVSCAASLYGPSIGVDSIILEPGVSTFNLLLEEPGTYMYSCGMGMFWGSFTAVAAPPAAP